MKLDAPLVAALARSGIFRQNEVERWDLTSSAALCCSSPYWAVSVNVATGRPSQYGPSAVTGTGPGLDGKVYVSESTTFFPSTIPQQIAREGRCWRIPPDAPLDQSPVLWLKTSAGVYL